MKNLGFQTTYKELKQEERQKRLQAERRFQTTYKELKQVT